ncbi:uncharacterized protein EDB91DRAFT_1108269 [Suillus paluster]|uniref:uncharacterized protein n=1 Tax=Suillus paluster TaxID=48578 RepID=UPI001B867C28|nr:uncharacterized protein EDB91DRAFT_1108269 [Suillus paluster]KAG1750568.1 hypothetical protein EDB91DRAFT_1108269 [Suillus paluster]
MGVHEKSQLESQSTPTVMMGIGVSVLAVPFNVNISQSQSIWFIATYPLIPITGSSLLNGTYGCELADNSST